MKQLSNKKALNDCMEDIKRFIEEKRTPKERINLLKRKIVHLKAETKKPFLNFKHIKMLKEHKKFKKETAKEKMKAAGVFSKKKKY